MRTLLLGRFLQRDNAVAQKLREEIQFEKWSENSKKSGNPRKSGNPEIFFCLIFSNFHHSNSFRKFQESTTKTVEKVNEWGGGYP